MRWGGNTNGRKWALRFGIILLTVGFLMPAPTPALAISGDAAFSTAMGLFSFLGATAIGYGIWEKTRPSDQPRILNGEFYAGGYLGAAFTPSQDLRYLDGFALNNGTAVRRQGAATLFNNNFANSLTGGVKFGYFTHTIPYLGLEVESCVCNSYVHRQTLAASPPIQGAARVTVPNDFWINWTTALHIVGRYGFLPDQEVPFGRLQPYVGLGPAFIVLYEEVDSAKNFGIDVMAGVRYMIVKHISAFVEYKFNYQWGVEIESHPFYLPNGAVGRDTATLDFANHKIVAGVAYHW
jgi:opacity protein-like surface antigen